MKSLCLVLLVLKAWSLVPPTVIQVRREIAVEGILGGTWQRIRNVGRRRRHRQENDAVELIAETAISDHVSIKKIEVPAFEEEDMADELSLSDVFIEIDELHKTKKYIEELRRLDELVESGESENAQVLWRLARVCCDLSDKSEVKEKEMYVRKGLAAAQVAIEVDPSCGLASKWYGIMLGLVGDFESVKTKIHNSQLIKDALDHADSKLPNDATVKLALGQWSLKLAGIGFIERQFAKAFFAAPPAASYQDALRFFEESYALKPTPRTSSLIKLTKRKLRSSS